MNSLNFMALLPLLVLTGGATLLMLQIAFLRNVSTSAAVATATLLAAALSRRVVQQPSPAWVQLPVFILGALSAMWCIERGLGVLAWWPGSAGADLLPGLLAGPVIHHDHRMECQLDTLIDVVFILQHVFAPNPASARSGVNGIGQVDAPQAGEGLLKLQVIDTDLQ